MNALDLVIVVLLGTRWLGGGVPIYLAFRLVLRLRYHYAGSI